MKILVCGDRNWDNMNRVYEVLKDYAPPSEIEIIEGGASGADAWGKIVAQRLEFKVFEIKANWLKFGKTAGPIRNRLMLDMKPDVVIAFHNDIENSKGTADTVREANKRKIPVTLVTDTSIIKRFTL